MLYPICSNREYILPLIRVTNHLTAKDTDLLRCINILQQTTMIS